MEGFEDGDGLDDDDMGDGSDMIDFNADLTNLAHNPVPLPLAQQNGGQVLSAPANNPNPIVAASDTLAVQPPVFMNLNDAMSDGQATVVAGPSTAGSGLFDSSNPVPGPSTASMQGHVNNGEDQQP